MVSLAGPTLGGFALPGTVDNIQRNVSGRHNWGAYWHLVGRDHDDGKFPVVRRMGPPPRRTLSAHTGTPHLQSKLFR